jgi:hypothetical protein
MLLATAQPVSGATGVVLVDEVVDELLLDEIMLDEFVTGEATLELRLLVIVGAGEEIDEFVDETTLIELELENVRFDDDEISLELELDPEITERTDELVMETGILELELLRRLNDVELTDVLEIGYGTLLELILLLNLGAVLVLAPSVVLSRRLVESLELGDVVEAPFALELLGAVLRLEAILELNEDSTFVDDPELEGVTMFVDDTELDGAEGRKMTVAKISPGETLRLCALKRVKEIHDEKLSTKEAAWQLACSAHSARHAVKPAGMEGRLMA